MRKELILLVDSAKDNSCEVRVEVGWRENVLLLRPLVVEDGDVGNLSFLLPR